MTLSRADVEHVARLARLRLKDSELDRLAVDLSHILDAMDALRQLVTSAIPPTAQVIPLRSVMREDVARPSASRELILKNAPDVEDGEFRVPRVLE
jgi:aspartyl-tRNA(Asn)/glutamyl-tRNA(Gln) amidotransferase subunit C